MTTRSKRSKTKLQDSSRKPRDLPARWKKLIEIYYYNYMNPGKKTKQAVDDFHSRAERLKKHVEIPHGDDRTIIVPPNNEVIIASLNIRVLDSGSQDIRIVF